MEKIQPYHEDRPWGGFTQFTLNQISTVKLLHVTPHKKNSLQSHTTRHEFWRVVSGNPIVTIGDLCEVAEPGKEYWIPQGEKHRIDGGETGGEVLEISLGLFDEQDIERFEDDFGRAA